MPLQIITTSDGSHSLLNTELNETYHSVHGAMRESIYVFIKNGLDYYMEQHNPKEIDILEVGFGTGLNTLLTLQYAIQNNIYVRYTTLETSPLHENIWSQLNFPEGEASRVHFRLLHETPWGTSTSLFPQFTLLKLNEPLQDVTFPDVYDVVYFDAFAPNKQPEMWEQPLLQKVAKSMKVNGVFVTYCAKGKLKRDLRDLSFKVETIAGPPGKREMVRALKIC